MNALITLNDLHVIDDEPRVQDLRLAEALGFLLPYDIRKVIRRNAAELQRYGAIFATTAKNTDPRGRGRPGTEYHLTEGQALLVCMFAETERAADVRQALIEVFMAWRKGQMAPPPATSRRDPAQDAFSRMSERLAALEVALGFDSRYPAERMAVSAAHLPIWGSGRRPDFWGDIEVRTLLTSMHRQATVGQVRAILCDRFGSHRTPSRSSIHRYWQQLDKARGLSGFIC